MVVPDPGAPLAVTALAPRTGMSERIFAQRFKDETAPPPGHPCRNRPRAGGARLAGDAAGAAFGIGAIAWFALEEVVLVTRPSPGASPPQAGSSAFHRYRRS